MIETKRHHIPEALVQSLERLQLQYTNPKTIYHFVWAWGPIIGVFGDGDNGMYEWFIWDDRAPSRLRTSDMGYGSDAAALCDGLLESGELAEAKPEKLIKIPLVKDLLEACRMVQALNSWDLGLPPDPSLPGKGREAWRAISAVIAKAEGRS